MNVGLTSLQSNLINYSVRQHVFKPIVLLVWGIAVAIFSGALIARTLSRYHRSHDYGHIRNNTYSIDVSDENLRSHPCEYIKNLAKSIRSARRQMSIEVHFKQHQNTQRACDAGGPTRQFFNLLFQSLKTQCSSVEAKPRDFHPYTNQGGTLLLVPQGTPTNNPKTSIFYDIGTVMTYVFFHSSGPLIGPVFHEAIFAAILSLDDHEIDLSYEQLSVATKVKMCKAFIHAQQASGANDFKTYLPILEFLEKGDQFTEEDFTDEVKYYYGSAEFEWEAASKSPREFLLLGGDEMTPPALNVEAIMKNAESKSQFLNKCLRHLLSHNKASSLGDIELTFFPIHTMAKAMKEVSKERWTTIRSLSTPSIDVPSSTAADPQIEAAKRLQRKIQGVLDREILVSKINVSSNNEVVQNQADWIKEWILDPETTDTLIEGLLTFWTGSSFIDWDKVQEIFIYAKMEGLLPTAATCSHTLFVSNQYSLRNERGELGPLHNHTKEGYDQVLNKIAGEYSNVFTHG